MEKIHSIESQNYNFVLYTEFNVIFLPELLYAQTPCCKYYQNINQQATLLLQLPSFSPHL